MRNLILIIIIAMTAAACSRAVYVPVSVPMTSTDSTHIASARSDTVVMVTEREVYRAGDTIRITEYRDRWRYMHRTDTVYKARTDTVTKVVTVPAATSGGTSSAPWAYAVIAVAVLLIIGRLRLSR